MGRGRGTGSAATLTADLLLWVWGLKQGTNSALHPRKNIPEQRVDGTGPETMEAGRGA